MATLQPQTIEFAESAPAIAEGTGVVAGTPAEVWAVLVDNERWPEWFGGGVTRVTPTSGDGHGVGATREVILGKGMGLRFHERFIAWDEGELWSFTGIEGPPGLVKLVERCTIAVVDEGHTRVTYRMAFELKPLLRWTAPLLKKGISQAVTKGMEGLAKEVVARRSA